MQEILEKIGLTKNEAKVYLSLLELGLTSSKAIIEKTSLHRQSVYDSLSLLIEKGVVSFIIQANRKYFKAAEPKQFLNYFEKNKKKYKKINKNLKRYCLN